MNLLLLLVGGNVFRYAESLSLCFTRSIANQNPTMEQAEKAIGAKLRRLRHRMRMYTVSDLGSENLDQHAAEIKEREQIVDDVIADIETLIEDFSSQLGQDKTASFQNKIHAVEQEFLVYRKSFASTLKELKTIPLPASVDIPSLGNLTLSESFQARQDAAKRKIWPL